MDLTNTLSQLVAIASPSRREEHIVDFIEQWLKAKGNVSLQRVGRNLLVSITGSDSTKALIFNGHIDTVEAGDEKLWQSEPLRLHHEQGKLYGLGTSDMKGAIAVFLHLIDAYHQTPPPCDVYCMFVAEEETTGAGTKELLEYMLPTLEKYDQVAGIIGEPSQLQVALGHRGNIFAEVHFTGKGGHSSRFMPHNMQAARKANKFIESIDDTLDRWTHEFADEYLGPPSVNVTSITTGSDHAINQIPTHCSLTLDIRTNAAIHPNIIPLIEAWVRDYDGELKIRANAPVGFCHPSEKIAQVAMQLAKQKDPEVRTGSTDQCFFTEASIPAIICGPGDPASIHAPNEYIEESQLMFALERYKSIVEKWAT